jgi:hypothetical protein
MLKFSHSDHFLKFADYTFKNDPHEALFLRTAFLTSFSKLSMTELFTHEEEEVLNQIPNNFPLQFKEDEEKAICFRSTLYFRRIVVRDGIIKGKFADSECDLAGSQVWIPQD